MRKRTILISIAAIALAVVGYFVFFKKDASGVTYQTGTVEKGTLVVSISTSGTTTAVNRIGITTGVTGKITSVLVKDGDTVKVGQTIMRVDLDDTGDAALLKAKSTLLAAQQAVTTAQQAVTNLSSDVTTAQDGVTQAKQNKVQLHREVLNAENAVIKAQEEYDAAVSGGQSTTTISTKLNDLDAAKDSLTIAKSKYASADASISKAKTNVTTVKSRSVSLNDAVTKAKNDLTTAQEGYNDATGTIRAPVAGTVADLTYATGMTILASTPSGAGAAAATKVASIVTDTLPTASFSVAEADAPKIKAGQKATLTFDSITDKTFTGTVIGIDRSGSVSSGVTSYPMTIRLDDANDEILPNMAVTANVITKTIADVLLVPNSAVKTSGTAHTVEVMTDGKVSSVAVEIGEASEAQTVITSGLTAGQTVVTATITAATTNAARSSSASSLFGGTTTRGGAGTTVISGGFPGGPPN